MKIDILSVAERSLRKLTESEIAGLIVANECKPTIWDVYEGVCERWGVSPEEDHLCAIFILVKNVYIELLGGE